MPSGAGPRLQGGGSACNAAVAALQAEVLRTPDDHRKQRWRPAAMDPRVRGDHGADVTLSRYFFTIEQAGLGGPNAWSPGIRASTL